MLKWTSFKWNIFFWNALIRCCINCTDDNNFSVFSYNVLKKNFIINFFRNIVYRCEISTHPILTDQYCILVLVQSNLALSSKRWLSTIPQRLPTLVQNSTNNCPFSSGGVWKKISNCTFSNYKIIIFHTFWQNKDFILINYGTTQILFIQKLIFDWLFFIKNNNTHFSKIMKSYCIRACFFKVGDSL